MSKKEEVQNILKDFFSEKTQVIFVYLFGSFVKRERYRDLNIGVYMKPLPDLIQQGKLESELEELVPMRIDLILLNETPEKNPAFAYEVLTEGELLVNKNPALHTNFKSKAFRYYFDTAYLRENINQAFQKRLESGNFGMRNYE